MKKTGEEMPKRLGKYVAIQGEVYHLLDSLGFGLLTQECDGITPRKCRCNKVPKGKGGLEYKPTAKGERVGIIGVRSVDRLC